MIDDSELRDIQPFDIFDAEARRLDGFFASLNGDEDWLRPTRCEGWRRRELLAHLAGSEEYNHATLDATVPALIERATQAGAEGLDGFNQWGVEQRADRSVEELLAEWRSANAETRRRFRERGWDGALATFVGPYPAGRQALHLAMELAVHADDMSVPVADGERRLRGAWQVRLARFTVREYDRKVTIEAEGGLNRVRAGDTELVIDDEGLIDACTARLPADHPMPAEMRELLRVFA
jgi:uncharacterized protein (TIGR03083 family)